MQGPSKMSLLLWLIFPTFVLVSLAISFQLNRKDPIAQMDEIFHIPQASLYCKGIYDQWNSKITTLPGLYIFSVGPIKLLQYIIDIPCSVFSLRMFNLVVNSLSFILIHYIVLHYHPFIYVGKRMLLTLTLSIFPLNYFFTFLYYTDPLATLFILIMHYMWIRKSYSISATAGFFAVLTRQTSIVWVAFHGALTINEIYLSATTNNNSIFKKQTRIVGNGSSRIYLESRKFDFKIYSELVTQVLARTRAYLFVGILFISFVYANNGIVVGDRKEHTVNVNFPQILYFALFTGLLTLPHLIDQSKEISNFAFKNKLMTIFIFLLNVLIVYFNTVAHHYNLESPHHYTHYFLIFVHYNSLYALSLVPLYTFCCLYIIYNSMRVLGKFMFFVFIFTLAANLIPQLLLEFRYFIPGFFIFRMRLISTKWKILLFEFATYFFINVITISLYIVRPKLFPDDDQIIMW